MYAQNEVICWTEGNEPDDMMLLGPIAPDPHRESQEWAVYAGWVEVDTDWLAAVEGAANGACCNL
jgi:hypothetical protein